MSIQDPERTKPNITRLPTPTDDTVGLLPEDHRDAAEHALEIAEGNPVLSGEQACAVAQVHALLAIELRLAQLCGEPTPAHRGTTNPP